MREVEENNRTQRRTVMELSKGKEEKDREKRTRKCTRRKSIEGQNEESMGREKKWDLKRK